jgi:hypothetical protein
MYVYSPTFAHRASERAEGLYLKSPCKINEGTTSLE